MMSNPAYAKTANFKWHAGADVASLGESLASDVMAQIKQSIDQKGSAVVALSGGSTPKPFFKALAKFDLDWSKVLITLVDERWVDSTHDLSNQAFMQRNLLDGLPSNVRFVSLYQPADSAMDSLASVLADYCAQTESELDAPRAFDVVVLGMGSDGHTASFFPDADNIAQLVDLNTANYLYTCYSPTTQVERITWSLPMLLGSSFLALHITGKTKEDVFEEAIKNGQTLDDICQLPIRSALFQDQTLLNVYYSD